jgi:hypothetical protein
VPHLARTFFRGCLACRLYDNSIYDISAAAKFVCTAESTGEARVSRVST